PNRSAAASTAPAVRPDRVCRCGVSGRSMKRCALRQAWEWAAPMKPYPIMPTFSVPAGVCGVVISGALLLNESFGPCGRGGAPAPNPAGRSRRTPRHTLVTSDAAGHREVLPVAGELGEGAGPAYPKLAVAPTGIVAVRSSCRKQAKSLLNPD